MARTLTLAQLATATGGTAVGEASVNGVSTDTRTLEPGQLFVALKGELFDGHQYLNEAAKKGAAALLVHELPIGSPSLPHVLVGDTTVAYGAVARAAVRDSFPGPVIGVTGSVGKTTTKELLAAVLEAQFVVHKSPANFNNEIGLPRTLLETPETATALVLEMGMRGAGQIRQLAAIARPTIGIVTGVGLSHVELLGSRANIAAAKAELLEALPEDGLAVFPAGDDFANTLRASTKAQALTVALDAKADVAATELSQQDNGWRATVTTPWGTTKLFVPSPGRFNVLNALFAVAVAGHLGIPLDSIARALLRFAPPEMRLESVKASSGATVLADCYNAAPDSMVGALETLAQTAVGAGGKRIAVLGEMKELGAHAAEGHALVGRAVARIRPDMLVLVGQATRNLSAAALMDGFPQDSVHYFDRTEQAAELLPFIVAAGDAVLVKGSRAMALEKVVRALAPDSGSAA